MSAPTLPASAYEALELPESTVKLLTTSKPSSTSDIASPNLLQNAQSPEQRLAPNQSSIVLYAELLLHIRTVTLFASLRSVHTRETKAKLSTDGCEIIVSHEGEEARIRLPIEVQGGGDAALELPAQPPSKELTLRLQIEEKDGTDMLGPLQSEERKVNIVPWDGATLEAMDNVEICCKSCGSRVVNKGKVHEWRDLPNENWAEMMDFWHCHKPDDHHLHDHTHDAVVGKKGYAAGNRLQAAEGLGFVDLASFLLKEQDCGGAEVSFEQDGQEKSIQCKQCRHVLGAQDNSTEGWRIWKWCIGISTSDTSDTSSSPSSPPTPYFITYSTQKWISARILHLIENSGVRKFHIHPSFPSHSPASPSPSLPTSTTSLLLWVFTLDLFYSSSIPSPLGRNDPVRAVKIFYQHQTWSPPQPGEVEKADVEDVEWPEHLFWELKEALEGSGKVLPVGSRGFKGWAVGLLERFDVGDLR
ncbi:hypothetical protein CC80DRAFT_495753 [Byssothecium circinans]|uniref:Ubiquitin-conjugating enzyme E2-binding protein n=1 Tax=Byssothecium circinans TaxID=147558 RepID=A0A6A5TGZ3_9PLEO|nr:hypothetical protein CC80DRAFT_495753 [Byssothecium circinans]